jgi:hypothetical protein
MENIRRKMLKMVAWHEEIFPTAKLFPSCRRKNCDVSIERKSIHVVGSVCVGASD